MKAIRTARHPLLLCILLTTLLTSCATPARSPEGKMAGEKIKEADIAYAKGDFAAAFRLYLGEAEGGNAAARTLVAGMYAAGEGVGQDYEEAMKWYRLAAEQGYAGARLNLGYMYNEGLGVGQDYGEAVKWYGSPPNKTLRRPSTISG